jgi:hypothetical protein
MYWRRFELKNQQQKYLRTKVYLIVHPGKKLINYVKIKMVVILKPNKVFITN